MRKFTFVAFILLTSATISVGQVTKIDSSFFKEYVSNKSWLKESESPTYLLSKDMILDSLEGRPINKDSILSSSSMELVNKYREFFLKENNGRASTLEPPKERVFEFIRKWASIFMLLIGLLWLFVFPLQWFFINRKIDKRLEGAGKATPAPSNVQPMLDSAKFEEIKDLISKGFLDIHEKLGQQKGVVDVQSDRSHPEPLESYDIQYCAPPQQGKFQPNPLRCGNERLITFKKTSDTKATFTIEEDFIDAALKDCVRWFSESFCDITDRFHFGSVVKEVNITPGSATYINGNWEIEKKMKLSYKNH